MIKRKKMISLLLVLTLVSGMFVQTYATEIDDTKKKAEELESKNQFFFFICDFIFFCRRKLLKMRKHLWQIS